MELLPSAYKSGHSTELALIKVQKDILQTIDQDQCVILLLLDLSAAFDTGDHRIFISRLTDRFGIDGKAHGWFKCYLGGRMQFVSVGSVHSASRPLNCGVPQGSVLGPILYLLYVDPLGDIMRHGDVSFHFYADDTQLCVSFKSSFAGDLIRSRSKLESCARLINGCYITTLNLLMIRQRCWFSMLSTVPLSLEEIQVATASVTSFDSAKNTGVALDSTLSFDKHVTQICKSSF